MRRAARIDRTQPEIVDALRRVGCTVQPLHTVGDGCPDLLVGVAGRTLLMEAKDGCLPQCRRRLTPLQTEWHQSWRGGPLALVRDVEGALRAVATARASDAIQLQHHQALTHLLVGLIRCDVEGSAELILADADRAGAIAAIKALTGRVA